MKKYIVRMLLAYTTIIHAQYYSQSYQDRYINERIFRGKRNGIFVDIGAHDGITYNNTYFFERELQWTGICIEPIPHIFEKLMRNRTCVCVQGCIADSDQKASFLAVTSFTKSEYTEMLSGLLNTYDPRHLARVERELAQFGGKKEIIEVQCYQLNSLLKDYQIDHIDLLSIDTEGAELEILRSIDFSAIDIEVITVENNFGTQEIELFLTSKGYQFITKLDADEVYRKVH